jgi:hypothetical protein
MPDANREGALSLDRSNHDSTRPQDIHRKCGDVEDHQALRHCLAAGKGEDITGIVAPALFVTFVSGVIATVAAVLQMRAQKAEVPKSDHQS